MATEDPRASQHAVDTADLEKFGYKQELKRELGTFSSFAVAFSYISPSTGIFTLFFLGMAALGGFMFWTWPVVALGQFIVALNFAELSSHFPVAGSVFQWTKYLAGRTYAWFTGWIYLFAGIMTVASVCATLPIALMPALNNMFGWSLNTNLGSADQKVVALITLVVDHDAEHLRREARGDREQHRASSSRSSAWSCSRSSWRSCTTTRDSGVIVDSSKTGNIFQFPAPVTSRSSWSRCSCSLYVIYGFDTASTLAEETRNPRQEAPKAVLASVIGAFIIGAIFLWGVLMAVPTWARRSPGFFGPQAIIESVMSEARVHAVPAGRLGGDLRVLHVDPDLDDPAGLRDGARRPAAVLEDAVEGEPAAAHADRRVRRRRRCSRRFRSSSSPARA